MSAATPPHDRQIVLLGDPVAHSLSPVMHNAGFRAIGLQATYTAHRCGTEELCRAIQAHAASGGGGNITVPHKQAAVGCGIPDSRVARLGVANVFVGIGGEAHLRNTDVDGVLALVDALDEVPERWLILGTGGSARAVVAAAVERGASVASRSRKPDRAREFEAWCTSIGAAVVGAEECGLAVNATPLGLHESDPSPADLRLHPSVRAVLDLTYRRGGTTSLVATAQARGLQAVDGREMLLVQGVAAWASWFPGVEPPIEVMRDALRGATL